ncbi:hypothetical protein CVT26_005124 [Gymnopilus dilepis]|uniref:Cytochrome P450 n=1 Tax=Gymnopilus dilepis TaxID=231916 RepID=A0A409Y0F1_9AGAR|nr:hypothetical protein CVT26_005124 [Gymnopilus dilepis]
MARARSNQRLVRALNLSNTFVSPDPATHKFFVGHAQHLLRSAQRRGWAHLRETAVEATQWQLSSIRSSSNKISSVIKPDSEQQELEIGFKSLIQNVTLVVVLITLLQVDRPAYTFSLDDVSQVAEGITALWALSKKSEPIPPHLLAKLTAHLRRLVPMDGKESDWHHLKPLDFVIPTWETLWRVVATVVGYANGDAAISSALEDFNVCPSDKTFRQLHSEDSPYSVQDVVSEAMRLHPPSKHIGRMAKWSRWCPSFFGRVMGLWTGMSLRRANVEKLLLCELWGPDANEFRPSRHRQREGFAERAQAMTFVFGHGPLRCIAASWAPLAAGLIAAAIMSELEANDYKVHAGSAIGGREGWNGWVVKRSEGSILA